jgi:hypothetical protein
MRLSAAVHRLACLTGLAIAAALPPAPSASADVTIKDRTVSQPLVLDQNEDYHLHKVYVSGVTDLAALTLTGKINSVNITHSVFSNVWAGVSGKAVAAEAQGAIVGSFSATDTAFEDAQHQLLCLREGAFGTVTFQRCKFRTTDSFLKRIYADDPWRNTPPTTEFANIDRLELLDNEYVNTILIVHPSVKTVIFRGDISNVRLRSAGTHVIRLGKDQDPASVTPDNSATALATPPPAPAEPDAAHHPDDADPDSAPAESRPAAAEAPAAPDSQPAALAAGPDLDDATDDDDTTTLVTLVPAEHGYAIAPIRVPTMSRTIADR